MTEGTGDEENPLTVVMKMTLEYLKPVQVGMKSVRVARPKVYAGRPARHLMGHEVVEVIRREQHTAVLLVRERQDHIGVRLQQLCDPSGRQSQLWPTLRGSVECSAWPRVQRHGMDMHTLDMGHRFGVARRYGLGGGGRGEGGEERQGGPGGNKGPSGEDNDSALLGQRRVVDTGEEQDREPEMRTRRCRVRYEEK